MVKRLSNRNSYSTLEENAKRRLSSAARRVLALKNTKDESETAAKFIQFSVTHCWVWACWYLLSIRLSMHCFSLSSVSSWAVCSSTTSPTQQSQNVDGFFFALVLFWHYIFVIRFVNACTSLVFNYLYLCPPLQLTRSHWRCCSDWEHPTPNHHHSHQTRLSPHFSLKQWERNDEEIQWTLF